MSARPCCLGCWNERHPDKPKTNVATIYLSEPEFCCFCGERAMNGLYVPVGVGSDKT